MAMEVCVKHVQVGKSPIPINLNVSVKAIRSTPLTIPLVRLAQAYKTQTQTKALVNARQESK